MTSTSAFRFDFQAAVADARRDYPRETENTLFIDVNNPSHMALHLRPLLLRQALLDQLKKPAMQWHRLFRPMPTVADISADAAKAFDVLPRSLQKKIQRDLRACEEIICAGSCVFRNGDKTILIYHGKPDTALMSDNADIENFFSFHHELGHIVTEKGRATAGSDLERQQAEVAADSFAVLQGFSKDIIGIPELDGLAWMRLMALAAWGDAIHCTSDALQDLKVKIEGLSATDLGSAEIAAIADAHASLPAEADAHISERESHGIHFAQQMLMRKLTNDLGVQDRKSVLAGTCSGDKAHIVAHLKSHYERIAQECAEAPVAGFAQRVTRALSPGSK